MRSWANVVRKDMELTGGDGSNPDPRHETEPRETEVVEETPQPSGGGGKRVIPGSPGIDVTMWIPLRTFLRGLTTK